jgi:hypothetical protein
MDPATLAATVTAFLTPILAKAGGAILDSAAAGIPDAVGGIATRLWTTIRKRFEGNPAATGAAADLAKDASDKDKQDAFQLQLKMALKEDREFAEALLALVKEAGGTDNIGDVSIKTGDISHSAIVIGNDNDVKSS